MTRVLLLGHGRMGQLIEALAPQCECEVVGIVSSAEGSRAVAAYAQRADVAIDFTVPGAVLGNVTALADAGINVVVGTTGWQDSAADVQALVTRSRIGALAASNFSIGLHVFRRAVAAAAADFAHDPAVGAWIHEAHHDRKKDAPSGTALTLRDTMVAAGYTRTIDMSSTRAGSIPGTHTVGFDAATETITLTHTVRDRGVFARGALDVARWITGRTGWLTMDDYLQERG